MTRDELASQLTGLEYPLRISKYLRAQAKAAGLVIIYGASDDLMEFDGALNEEIGAWNGIEVLIDQKGLLPDFETICEDGDKEDLRDYFKREPNVRKIEAVWGEDDGPAWSYKTDIPHVTFEVMEDDEPYCRGIVFSLADLGQEAAK